LLNLGFPVLGYSRSAKSVPGVVCHAGVGGFEPFLRASRILVCLLPLTPDTRGIVNQRSLGLLHGGSGQGYLINVARGAHVVQADLLDALRHGKLAGAALDVFEQEPLPADHPFRADPRFFLTPHIAAQTLIAEGAAQIAAKLAAMSRGEPVSGAVDAARGY
jgi:glyoxylate/hydroxypyruvate reductase